MTVPARASRASGNHRRKRGHSTFPFRKGKSRMSPFPLPRRDHRQGLPALTLPPFSHLLERAQRGLGPQPERTEKKMAERKWGSSGSCVFPRSRHAPKRACPGDFPLWANSTVGEGAPGAISCVRPRGRPHAAVWGVPGSAAGHPGSLGVCAGRGKKRRGFRTPPLWRARFVGETTPAPQRSRRMATPRRRGVAFFLPPCYWRKAVNLSCTPALGCARLRDVRKTG